jgi:hypothetical protein
MTAIIEVPLEEHATWVNTFTHESEGTELGFFTRYPEMDLIVFCC